MTNTIGSSINIGVELDIEIVLNVIPHQSMYHRDGLAGTPNGCIFHLVSPVPTMAHLFGRLDPPQSCSSALLNHYRHPLCFLRDRPLPLSDSYIMHFACQY